MKVGKKQKAKSERAGATNVNTPIGDNAIVRKRHSETDQTMVASKSRSSDLRH